MDANPKLDVTDTYVLEEDVMDEMENLEATLVLPEALDPHDDTGALDQDFLDDIETATDVFEIDQLPSED